MMGIPTAENFEKSEKVGWMAVEAVVELAVGSSSKINQNQRIREGSLGILCQLIARSAKSIKKVAIVVVEVGQDTEGK